MATRPTPPSDQLVTSSDLVRHFGLWQERAARAPLYVLHRGRPRFVLTSIETMDALCAPHAGDAGASAFGHLDPMALLDGVSDMVLIADDDGAIVATSRAARAHFGSLVIAGALVAGISAPATRPFLIDTIRRIVATGVGDRLEIPSAAREGRILAVSIEPTRRGVVLFAQDGTTARDHTVAVACNRAFETALLAARDVASVTINQRGYIASPSPSLAALTGLTAPALAQIRFVALAEIGARVALGHALEQALTGETPPMLSADLLVNRAGPIRVRIGLAPIRSGSAIEGVAAVVVAD